MRIFIRTVLEYPSGKMFTQQKELSEELIERVDDQALGRIFRQLLAEMAVEFRHAKP